MRLIKRIKPRLFLAVDGERAIHLNFNPFVEHFNLEGSYVLMHWNRLYREYGYYISNGDFYITATCKNTSIDVVGIPEEIPLNDGTLPTACVIYRNAKALIGDGCISIEAV